MSGSERRTIEVRGGVVLATGYFSANAELSRAHGRPPEHDGVEPLFDGATGDGVTLAVALGAATSGMSAAAPPHFRTVSRPYIHPPAPIFEAGADTAQPRRQQVCERTGGRRAGHQQPAGKGGLRGVRFASGLPRRHGGRGRPPVTRRLVPRGHNGPLDLPGDRIRLRGGLPAAY